LGETYEKWSGLPQPLAKDQPQKALVVPKKIGGYRNWIKSIAGSNQ